MPNTDREVFSKLTGGGTPQIEDYITYALFAFERQEWLSHRNNMIGRQPTEDEIAAWIGNISDYQFEQMRN